MINRLRSWAENGLWILLVLILPITSLPLLSKVTGGTMVAPAAIIPLVLLAMLFLAPFLFHGGRLPRQVLPVFGLFLAAVFSSALSFFIDIPLFREINRLSNSLSSLVTLAIGIGFYLLATTWTDTPQKLNRLYFWVNLSGLIIILWSFFQAAMWYSRGAYPDWMAAVQRLVSSSGNLYDGRVTGLAFEPSWLGHQLVMFYLPYWMAATVRRTSAVPRRLFGLTFENALLVAGVVVLFLAFSRGAIISLILMISLLLIRLTRLVVRIIQNRIHYRQLKSRSKIFSPGLLAALIWSGVVVFFGAMLAGLVFALTRLDPRMANLFSLLQQRLSFTELAYKLVFGERVVFWDTGLEVFSAHPIFGVGLANAGYFFPEKLTAFGWTVVESFKLYYSTALPNPLNLWVRLLAETGILGFAIMISWLIILWKTGRFVRTQPNSVLCTAGLAGQLALIALLMEGMSVDTFAFPYFWLTFGWLTAAAEIARRSQSSGLGQPAA